MVLVWAFYKAHYKFEVHFLLISQQKKEIFALPLKQVNKGSILPSLFLLFFIFETLSPLSSLLSQS